MDLPVWFTYSFVTLLVSAPFYYAIIRAGGGASENFPQQFRRLMFVPGIIAFGFRILLGIGFGDLVLGPGSSFWLYLVALLLPITLELILVFAAIRLNLSRAKRDIVEFSGAQVAVSSGLRLILGNQKQSLLRFIPNLVLTVFVGSVMIIIFAFIEEFGWRGFLQPRMIDSFGLVWGIFLTGVIWGIWHIPLVWTGYQFPEYPRLGALVFMPIFTIAAGILTGYLYWLSGSLWVVALFNASTKVSQILPGVFLGDDAGSRRVRTVWLWIWLVIAGFGLALWEAGS